MEESKNSFLRQQILAVTILLLVAAQLGRSLGLFFFVLCFLLVIGSGVSYWRHNRVSLAEGWVARIAALAIFIWMISAVLNSYFGYKEVAIILLKAGFLVGALFSFLCHLRRSRMIIVALSIPLCLGSFLYVKKAGLIQLLSLAVLFFAWLSFFKTRFDDDYLEKSIYRFRWGFFAPPAVSALAVFLFAAAIFFPLHMPRLVKTGFFSQEDIWKNDDMAIIEAKYYEAQNKIQEEIGKASLRMEVSEDRHAAMRMLSMLVRERTETVEVEKALEGLISLFKTPGPGLEKSEGEEITHILHRYTEHKASVNRMRTSDEIMQNMKRGGSNVAESVSMLWDMGRSKMASNRSQVNSASAAVQKNISRLDKPQGLKDSLKNMAQELREWGILGSYLEHMRLLQERLQDSPAGVQEEYRAVSDGIETMRSAEDFRRQEKAVARMNQRFPDRKSENRHLKEMLALRFEILASQSIENLSRQMVESGLSQEEADKFKQALQDARQTTVLRPQESLGEELAVLEMKSLEQSIRRAQEEGRITSESAKRLVKNNKDLRDIALSQAKKDRQIAKIKAKEEALAKQEPKFLERFLPLMVKMIFWFLLVSVAVLLSWFLALLVLALRSRRKLQALYGDPRKFIVGVYENLRNLVRIFGMDEKAHLPPLLFAYTFSRRQGIPGEALFNLTDKFEEAKYSHHLLKSSDASAALHNYNACLRQIYNQGGLFSRLAKRFAALIKGSAVFISGGRKQ